MPTRDALSLILDTVKIQSEFYMLHLSLSFISQDAFSTLDLVSSDKVEYLLIIAPTKESYQLAQAAFKVAEDYKASLKVCVMWQEQTTSGFCSSENALLPWKNIIDVVQVKKCLDSPSWWDLCRMSDRGAILVRPDEHIAWRSKLEIGKDPVLVLRGVFRAVLGFSPASHNVTENFNLSSFGVS